MRRKIVLGIVIVLALAGLGHFIGPTVIVGGLVVFGVGFFVGRRQRVR